MFLAATSSSIGPVVRPSVSLYHLVAALLVLVMITKWLDLVYKNNRSLKVKKSRNTQNNIK